jgi:hypothetical protein
MDEPIEVNLQNKTVGEALDEPCPILKELC